MMVDPYREYAERYRYHTSWVRTPRWAFWRPAWRRWPGHIECDWEYATNEQVAHSFLAQEFGRETTT
jgi:hypothetical protein